MRMNINYSKVTPFLIFSENVEAFYDVWILGDNFAKEASPSLQALKRKSIASKLPLPYIFQHFNVCEYQAGTGFSGIAHMIHPLVQALNNHFRLPKYIIMMPDKDILTAFHANNINAALVMGSTIHYLIRQIDTFLERCRHDLESKRLGAIPPFETKVVWIRMLKRPQNL